MRTLDGHDVRVQCVAYSPDGKMLVSAGKDGTIRLWSLDTSEKLTARYNLPDGGVDELKKFLEGLEAFHPATFVEFALHGSKASQAKKAAAEKILELEKDESSEIYRAASLVVLKDRVATIAGAKADLQRQTLADLKTHLDARIKQGLTLEDVLLATALTRELEAGGNDELTADAFTALAKLFAQDKDEGLSALSVSFEGAARRLALIGKEIELTGSRMDGLPFDWAAYRGKVVLVDFCNTRSRFHPQGKTHFPQFATTRFNWKASRSSGRPRRLKESR